VAAHVEGFVTLLRQHGVRCGQSEVLDAFRGLAVLGDQAVASRERLHAALRCTLCKGGPDAHVFDRVFDLYFGGVLEVDERLSRSLEEQVWEQAHGEGEVAGLAHLLSDETGRQALWRALVGGRAALLEMMLRAAALGQDFTGLKTRLQLGYYGHRLMQRLGVSALEEEAARLRASLEGRYRAEALGVVFGALEERLGALRQAARDVVERELERRAPDSVARGAGLMGKSLSGLTPEEVVEMRRVVRQLGERLKSAYHRRRVERRGYLDGRRTLRQNLSRDGVPFRVVFRRRRRERPQLVVLCDVSDSVRHASLFMLQLVHTLQSLFSRVRSFVFVSDVGEVTSLFREHTVEEAADLSVAGRVVSLHANSNFGHAFLRFHRQHLDAVNRSTTVMVLGDGRNNHNPAHAWVLHDLRRRARKLLWLCTEERESWGLGDSEMETYAQACTQVEVVRNLWQLRRAVDGILR
jgi:hypothetical protein